MTNTNVRLVFFIAYEWSDLDITYVVIVCDNGTSGFLGEHSCLDGTATLRLNEFVLAAVSQGRIGPSLQASSGSLPEPKELHFDIDSKTSSFIKRAEQNFDKLIGDHELEVKFSTT